jgi:hypothetical protein
MITIIKAHTSEIDDIETAVSDITSQLAAGQSLLKHSIGLVSCFADFIGSGVVDALAKKLPFEIAGTTTLAASTNGVQGEMILILTVLTSDDEEFCTGITEPVLTEDPEVLKRAYKQAAGIRTEKPALMLSFAPLLMNVGGDFFVDSFSDITGNVPNFGTLAVDHNSDYHEAHTILNGEAFRDRYVFILVYGNIKPRFFIGGIAEEKAFRDKGVVTASAGNQLQGVNGVTVADYLTGLGLNKDENGAIIGINSFPFILDYGDGTQPVIRVMFAITPDGSAVCGGNVPVGATLTVGSINAEEVLTTTERVLKTALQAEENNAMLIFSCVGRYFAQGFNTTAEMEKTEEILGGVLPFHLCYSGTELCPVYGKDGILKNRSHNDTMVICVL